VPEYKDYYKIMGVARDVSQDELKRVYRRLARKYHPDVSKEANAEARFKEVQEAYEVLKDPQKRAAYDQLGSNWRQGQEFRPPPDFGQNFEFSGSFGEEGGFSDFFSSLFGQRPGAAGGRARGAGARGFAMAGDDQVAAIEIDLEDSFRGDTRTVELKGRTLKITIPAGIVEGQRIRLAGQGSPGHGGAPSGDLYLEVKFREHRLFKAEGRRRSQERLTCAFRRMRSPDNDCA
jgi:curved DNA-binding protein